VVSTGGGVKGIGLVLYAFQSSIRAATKPLSLVPMLEAFRHAVHAAGYSWAGFRHLFKTELAARIEVGIAVLALIWLLVLGRPVRDFAILAILFCILISVEALNTAIERIVDRLSPELSDFGKVAKDLGSAAVFAMLSAGGVFLAAVTADAAGLISF